MSAASLTGMLDYLQFIQNIQKQLERRVSEAFHIPYPRQFCHVCIFSHIWPSLSSARFMDHLHLLGAMVQCTHHISFLNYKLVSAFFMTVSVSILPAHWISICFSIFSLHGNQIYSIAAVCPLCKTDHLSLSLSPLSLSLSPPPISLFTLPFSS